MFNRTKNITKKIATGFVGDYKKIVGTEEIKNNAKWIGQMWKSLTQKEKGRVETFEQAKTRLNVTDDDITKIRRNYIICFYIVFVGFIYCLGYLAQNIASKNLGGILSSIGIGSVLFAFAFQYSFRAYQIKIRELCSVKKYIHDMKEWIAH